MDGSRPQGLLLRVLGVLELALTCWGEEPRPKCPGAGACPLQGEESHKASASYWWEELCPRVSKCGAPSSRSLCEYICGWGWVLDLLVGGDGSQGGCVVRGS